MADEKLILNVDDDWKKQAQEEKRKLVEQAQQREAKKPTPSSAGVTAGQVTGSTSAGKATGQARQGGTARAQREIPQASFSTIVQTIMTQAMYYLGELQQAGETPVNLDMAKHHVDTLSVLEEKTRGNLSDDEKKMLDSVLYEVRMRYVQVAQRYIM